MQILFILMSVCLAADLDKFIDKEIRVFFASANHVFLGLDMKTSRLTARSKYYDLDGFSTVARLIPDSSYFRLRFRSNPVCVEGDEIRKCDVGTNWTVHSEVFGYTISDGSKCLTLAERSVVKMMPCTESEDQVVDFKLKSEDQECGQDGHLDDRESRNHDLHREIIVINVPSKEPQMEHTKLLQPIQLVKPATVPVRHIVTSDEQEIKLMPMIREKHSIPALPVEKQGVVAVPVKKRNALQTQVLPQGAKLRIITASGTPSQGYLDDSNAGFLDFVNTQLIR